jgi:hypothetical protein
VRPGFDCGDAAARVLEVAGRRVRRAGGMTARLVEAVDHVVHVETEKRTLADRGSNSESSAGSPLVVA